MKDTSKCGGCRNNFYNGNNGDLGVKQCWSVGKATVVVRFKIGTWTMPTAPGAFAKVRVPDCYHADGSHFYEKLPSNAKKPRGGR